MRKIKKVCKVLIILSLFFSLSGFRGQEELEEIAYVIGLGLDRSQQEGKVKVTMLIANPEVGSMQGGGGSNEKPKDIISFDAVDLITAKATANSIISRDISYELLKVIIASEEFAKGEDFVQFMYDILREREIRMDSYFAVCKEKASDYFMENQPKMETRPHKYFQFMIDHGVENGFIPESTLFRFFSALDRRTDLFLAMYTSNKKIKNSEINYEDDFIAGQLNATGNHDKTQFIGSAVFRNGKMIDTLTGNDTRIVNVLDDTTDIQDILVNLPDPFSDTNQQIAARILKVGNNKVKMNLKSAIPKITITVPLNVEVLSNPSMTNYQKDPKKEQILKEHIKHRFETNFEELFKKSQTELKGSPYPLSIYARKYFKTIQEFEQFNWVNSYPKADITVKSKITLVELGTQKKKIRK